VPDYTVKRIDEMHGLMNGHFKLARAELGVRSFGMQVIDMPPNGDRYPYHDHVEDGQEEVYVVLRGGGELEIEGEPDRIPLDPETMARVGPEAKRKVWAGPEGMRMIVLGGRPGHAFEPKPFTEVPDAQAPA
jgi:uncharacterized cupin superfamily protein